MDFSKYENKLGYPKKPLGKLACHCGREVDATVEKSISKGVIVHTALTQFCPKCGDKCGKEIESMWDQYRIDHDAYYNSESQNYTNFKEDALTEVGLSGHPKAEKAFSFAWGKGHSSGRQEVFLHLQDIAEILL